MSPYLTYISPFTLLKPYWPDIFWRDLSRYLSVRIKDVERNIFDLSIWKYNFIFFRNFLKLSYYTILHVKLFFDDRRYTFHINNLQPHWFLHSTLFTVVLSSKNLRRFFQDSFPLERFLPFPSLGPLLIHLFYLWDLLPLRTFTL